MHGPFALRQHGRPVRAMYQLGAGPARYVEEDKGAPAPFLQAQSSSLARGFVSFLLASTRSQFSLFWTWFSPAPRGFVFYTRGFLCSVRVPVPAIFFFPAM